MKQREGSATASSSDVKAALGAVGDADAKLEMLMNDKKKIFESTKAPGNANGNEQNFFLWDVKNECWKKRSVVQPTWDGLMGKYEIPGGTELEIEVYLWYENAPMKFAYAPKFPKKKTYSWWLLLGDAENDELISMKRMLMMPTNRKWQRKKTPGARRDL